MTRFGFMIRLGSRIGARRFDLVAQACEDFLSGSKVRGDKGLAFWFAALAYERLAQWDKALRHSLASIEVDPDDFSMLRVAARSLVEEKRLEEAAGYARRMIEAGDKHARPRGFRRLFSLQVEKEAEKAQWMAWAKEYLHWFASRQ